MLSLTHRRGFRRQRLVAGSFIVIGFVLAAAAAGLIIHDHAVRPRPPADSLRTSSAPSSKKPSAAAVNSYRVAPDLPKYLSIPAISVPKTRVMQLGVTKNDQIATPNNIYNAGWYNRSAKPGQNGAMFIYGHVSSWQADGVFYNLKKLKAGDTVSITRGDNKTFTYQVVSSKIYDYRQVNMNQVLAPINAGKPGLNLMTCTGQVIKGTSEFNQRLVVFTSLASS
ncbi:MAG TPA: class F sortase [Candidatus Saccharimonadales bacterium]|nr:class F sortase [Candidatus Saccharimonadales bacterium]